MNAFLVAGATIVGALLTIFAIWVLIAMIVKAFAIPEENVKEIRQLENLVDRANKGDREAQRICDHDPRIKKGMQYCREVGTVVLSYHISAGAIDRLYGFR